MRNLLIILALATQVLSYSQSEWFFVNQVNSTLTITDKNTGYYYYDEEVGSHGYRYFVKKSTDGMSSFTTVRSEYGSFGCCTIESMYFCDNDTGFIAVLNMGETSVQRTMNGGSTWGGIGFGSQYGLRLYFLTANYGFYANHLDYSGNGVLKKYDNGAITTSIESPDYILHGAFTKIWFNNYSTGFITTKNSANYGVVLRTDDEGETWNEVKVDTINRFKDICFMDSSNGFIVGENGLLLLTEDAGVTWNEVDLGVTVNLNSISFYNEQYGYIVGNNETILKTEDGGVTWEIVDFSFMGNLIYTKCVENEDCFVLTSDGRLYRNFEVIGIPEKDLMNDIEVFPIPATDCLNINIPDEIEDFQVNIYSNSGAIVFSDWNKKNIRLNIPKGFYLIEIKSLEGVFRKKLIIN
jgi:hypothetical protein